MSSKLESDVSDTSEDASADAVDVAEKGGVGPRLERGVRVNFKVGQKPHVLPYVASTRCAKLMALHKPSTTAVPFVASSAPQQWPGH